MKSANGLIALTLLASAAAIAPALSPAAAQTSVTRSAFGKTPDGQPVEAYTLKDKALTVKIITWGAHIIDIEAPDRNGKVTDVVLGYSSLDGYLADHKTYMGSVVGRYGNRIAKGEFTIDGVTSHVDTNERGNTLHGGKTGFDYKNWSAAKIADGVELTLVSPDGDMGFPGKLTAHVRYTLEGDKLKLSYSATTDKPTVVNLTNHSYFNLAGGGQILDEVAMINADHYTPTDAHLIPTGDLTPVAGTPFDFKTPTVIGSRIHQDDPQLKGARGYDHNFALNPPHDLSHPAVIVTDPKSGRTLTIFTTEPGVQFYTGNSLDGSFTGQLGKEEQYDGFCMETQHFPDSPNHPKFASTTLEPGQTYRSTTVFEFSAK